jgi:multiple sugar transport system permease protein
MDISSNDWRVRWAPLLFLLPTAVIIAAVVIYPMFSLLTNGLYRWNLLSGVRTWTGLGNYASILTDPLFLKSLLRTTIFALVVVAVELSLGFLLAVLFNRTIMGEGVLRSFFLAPMLIAPVAAGLIWRFMYEPSIGIINYLLSLIGLPAVRWISQTSTALPSVGVTEIWQWTPFVFLVFLAGLQGIPRSVLEAATLDGASSPRIMREIQIPMLRWVIAIIALLRLIDVFKMFDLIYVITRGGPGNSTYLVAFYNYVVGFTQFQMGKASATAFIILNIISIMTLILIRIVFRGAKL